MVGITLFWVLHSPDGPLAQNKIKQTAPIREILRWVSTQTVLLYAEQSKRVPEYLLLSDGC